MAKRENERQEKATEAASGPEELARRRAELIAEFQAYMHVTSQELSLASSEETDALRTPLLSMKLTEEDISTWEKFRPLIQKHLHAAQVLHEKIGRLLAQAADSRLLDSHDLAGWDAFFRSAGIGFQEKEQGAQELARHISLRKGQEAAERPRKERQEQVSEKDTAPKEKKRAMKPEQRRVQEKNREENTAQTNVQEKMEDRTQEEPLSHLQSTRIHTQWLLTLLPSSIAPLYAAATKRGSTALRTVQKILEQSLVRQNFGLRHRGGTVILTREKIQNTEESLATFRTAAAQGEEAKTIILEPISLATQSAVVHSIHHPLLEDLLTLEQHGMHPSGD